MEDLAQTSRVPPRKGMKSFVLTGIVGGAGSAVVLPPLWELAVGSAGMSPHWLGQYVVVFVIGGLAAAPIWAGIGAVAGYCAGLIWRRQERLGPRKTTAGMLFVVAAILGTVTGTALGFLFSSALVGTLLGVGVAAVAAAATLLKIRQLKRAESRTALVTNPAP